MKKTTKSVFSAGLVDSELQATGYSSVRSLSYEFLVQETDIS